MNSDYRNSINHRNALKSTGYYFIRLSFFLALLITLILIWPLQIPTIWALIFGAVIWKTGHWFLWRVYRRIYRE